MNKTLAAKVELLRKFNKNSEEPIIGLFEKIVDDAEISDLPMSWYGNNKIANVLRV